jgi:hypothetical protein
VPWQAALHLPGSPSPLAVLSRLAVGRDTKTAAGTADTVKPRHLAGPKGSGASPPPPLGGDGETGEIHPCGDAIGRHAPSVWGGWRRRLVVAGPRRLDAFPGRSCRGLPARPGEPCAAAKDPETRCRVARVRSARAGYPAAAGAAPPPAGRGQPSPPPWSAAPVSGSGAVALAIFLGLPRRLLIDGGGTTSVPWLPSGSASATSHYVQKRRNAVRARAIR